MALSSMSTSNCSSKVRTNCQKFCFCKDLDHYLVCFFFFNTGLLAAVSWLFSILGEKMAAYWNRLYLSVASWGCLFVYGSHWRPPNWYSDADEQKRPSSNGRLVEIQIRRVFQGGHINMKPSSLLLLSPPLLILIPASHPLPTFLFPSLTCLLLRLILA